MPSYVHTDVCVFSLILHDLSVSHMQQCASHKHLVSVGSPIEVKQLSMESYSDMTDMQERLIAVLMEVVGVFLWTSVLEGTHRKVGESVSSYCVCTVIPSFPLCWYCVNHWESNVCCLCLLSLWICPQVWRSFFLALDLFSADHRLLIPAHAIKQQ